MNKRCLICVDIQLDFMPGGTLPVPYGDTIVPLVRALAKDFRKAGHLVVFTQDWHPANHCSFIENGGDWPIHCVQGTAGADIPDELYLAPSLWDLLVRKGQDQSVDSFSAFYDNDHKNDTGLAQWLKERGVDTVYVCGLALDFCVLATAFGANEAGFETYIIEDACKGVGIPTGGCGPADSLSDTFMAIEDSDVMLIRSDELVRDGVIKET